ncbi:putative repeat protein (TIGR03943 family) [Nocardiopsis mwathae]|uniref:Putative repeat protein (TIGR03943 family) n=1 Tax=Nocardiopsis mwathae TaxID=1472723 RepID=A0A7W9YFS8_9ACTN|nr:putative repeat protein (TIGR03943 family) [Nocardiopsis mwathae]
MNRIAQGLVLVLLGAAALSSTVVSDLYLNYVRDYFQPFLIAAGVVLVLLGGWLIAAEVRSAGTEGDHAHGDHSHGGGHDDGHGHDHSRAPGVAWLLLLPVVAVFVVAPPALGSFTAGQATDPGAPSPRTEGRYGDALEDTDPSQPAELKLQEFVLRAWTDEEREMAGRPIELTGFAVPNEQGEGWYLARLQMSCCAADAVVNRVLVTNAEEPEKDSWWTARGTWVEPEGDLQSVRDHRFSVDTMTQVDNPPDPYE